MIIKQKKIIVKNIYLLLSLMVVLVGCVPSGSHPVPAQQPHRAFDYQSELAEPHAKALYAFSRFRLLGSENRWDEAIASLERAVQFDPDTDYLQLILAKAYLHREQPEKAVTTLKNLLKKSPDNFDAHELLGDVYSYQQNFAAALTHFRRALEYEPEREALQMRLVMTLARLERQDEAIDLLEQLTAKHPDAIIARLSLARFYLEKGLTDKAKHEYQSLLEQDPGQQQAILEYGQLLEQQDVPAALELYQTALKWNPLAAAIHQRLGQLYLSRQQPEAALEQFHAVRQQFPDNQQIIGRMALIELELERWEAAEADFRLLLDTPQHQDQNRYYLAIALSAQGKTAEAINTLKLISTDAKIYPDTVLQLAYLYKQAGQQNKAVETLQQALSEDLSSPDIYYYLTAFLADQGKHEEARTVAVTGVEKYPDDIRLLYQLGIFYEKSGEHQAATEKMKAVLQLNPDHADALNFLAYQQAEQGIGLDSALAQAQKALAIKPSGYIRDTLGWIFFKLGRFAESRVQLEEAVRMQPEDAVIREHLGDLYRAMKLWQLAKDTYRQVLQLDPQAIQAGEKLRVLERGEQK